MAALLEVTYELGSGKKIIGVTLDPTGLNETQIQTAFSSFLSTNFSGWAIGFTTYNEERLYGHWIVDWLKKYRITCEDRMNADGTITNVYTVTEP